MALLVMTMTKDFDIDCGRVLSAIARVCGGKAGGRGDFAQGFVPDENLESALTIARGIVERLLTR